MQFLIDKKIFLLETEKKPMYIDQENSSYSRQNNFKS